MSSAKAMRTGILLHTCSCFVLLAAGSNTIALHLAFVIYPTLISEHDASKIDKIITVQFLFDSETPHSMVSTVAETLSKRVICKAVLPAATLLEAAS